MAPTLTPDLAKFVGPQVPVPRRLMAARGLVPLPPALMAQAYYFLCQAAEPEVQAAAKKSVAGLPAHVLNPALQNLREPEVLGFYAASRQDDAIREVLCTNPATPVETLAAIARSCGRLIQGILVQNDQQLLKGPLLSDALLENPALDADYRARVVEFRKSFLGIDEAAPEEESAAGGDAGAPGAELEGEMELLEGEDIGLAAAGDVEGEEDFPEELLVDGPVTEDGEGGKNLATLLSKLSISQKVKLATLGNKAARQMLVRDPNRLVCTAVLRSPRLQEDEVEEIAKNRNVDEQVLRIIAANKNWGKNYSVKKSLCENPKAPAEIAAKLVVNLNEKDMKGLSKNKNVSTAVRNNARRIIQAREELIRRKQEKK